VWSRGRSSGECLVRPARVPLRVPSPESSAFGFEQVSMTHCYLASHSFAGTKPRPNVHPCNVLQGPPRMSLILNAL